MIVLLTPSTGSLHHLAINQIKVWQNAFVKVSICVEFIDFTTGVTRTARRNEFQTGSDLHLWLKELEETYRKQAPFGVYVN